MNLLHRHDLPIPTAPFSFSVPESPTTETLIQRDVSFFFAISETSDLFWRFVNVA